MDTGEMKPSLQLGLAQMLQMSNANQGNNSFQSALANGISMSDHIQVWWLAGRQAGKCLTSSLLFFLEWREKNDKAMVSLVKNYTFLVEDLLICVIRAVSEVWE